MIKIQKTLINKKGERLVFDDIIPNGNGYYTVLDGKKGALDKDGIEIIKPKYDSIELVEYGCYEAALKYANKVLRGLFDSKGKEILPVVCDKIRYDNEGIIIFSINGLYGFINLDNNCLVEPTYEEIGPFERGKAKVKRSGKFGYINKQGVEFIPAKYDKISDFYADVADTTNNGKYGYIREDGFEILEPICDETTDFEYGFGFALLGNEYICVNKEGKIVARYDKKNGLISTEGYHKIDSWPEYEEFHSSFESAIEFESGLKFIELKECYVFISCIWAEPIEIFK